MKGKEKEKNPGWMENTLNFGECYSISFVSLVSVKKAEKVILLGCPHFL